MCEKVSPLTLFCPKHSLLLLYEESCEFRRQSTKVSVVQSRDAQLLHFTQRGQSQRLQLPICISLTLYRNKYRNMAIHFSNRTNKWLWMNKKHVFCVYNHFYAIFKIWRQWWYLWLGRIKSCWWSLVSLQGESSSQWKWHCFVFLRCDSLFLFCSLTGLFLWNSDSHLPLKEIKVLDWITYCFSQCITNNKICQEGPPNILLFLTTWNPDGQNQVPIYILFLFFLLKSHFTWIYVTIRKESCNKHN